MRNNYINLVDTEEKVVVWDDTMKIFVVKFKLDEIYKNKMQNKYINLVDTEEKVVVWDDTMKIFVVKFKRDVKLFK